MLNEGSVSEKEIALSWDVLKRFGAYMRGHFARSSGGEHYSDHFQIPLAIQYVKNARILSSALARVLRRSGRLDVSSGMTNVTIVAPGDAGIPVAFWVGEAIQANRILWAMPTGRKGTWSFRPFIELGKGEKVLLVDDTVHTGRTLRGMLAHLQKKRADVAGIAVVVDRREEHSPEFEGIPIYSVISLPAKGYPPERCPMCKKGDRLVTIP